MISSVSSVSFRGDKDVNALINSPGKFSNTTAPAPQSAVQNQPAGDNADLSTKAENKEDKKHTGAIIGGIIGALFVIWAGLGIAVGKGKMADWNFDKAEGIAQKAKKAVFQIGESAKKAYDATLGKLFNKAKKAEGESTPAASQS